uniref:vWA domain-containing protein n=1 Tax=Castellaniella defragrans TaxID=75697 RepID=UPI003340C04C
MSMTSWFAFDRPWALWLALAGVLPLWRGIDSYSAWPRLTAATHDTASNLIHGLLQGMAALALAALALGMAGPHIPDSRVQHIGHGAHMVLLIDRSSSMNSGFAGGAPGSDAESKAAAAKRLLGSFTTQRPHDRVGVIGFSTMPMLVLPLTGRPQAIQAAIDAIDRPGLAYTDVGRGLAMALALFGNTPDASVSRVIIMVSDGAAVIDRRIQERLRADIAARPVQLYWLFLRTAGSPGIYDKPKEGIPDTPQSMPERHLDIFFKSLGVPYRAFEAASADDVARAIQEIDDQQQSPLRYTEYAPRVDLHHYALATAILCLLLLIAAKSSEARFQPREK